jgi:hypothetical protein
MFLHHKQSERFRTAGIMWNLHAHA